MRAVDDDRQAYIRLLVVDPGHRKAGVGRSLLQAAEDDARELAATRMAIGADAPYYLFAGIPVEQTAMLCLAEAARYNRAETNFNMTVALGDLPDASGTTAVAGPGDRPDVEALVTEQYAMWTKEVLRALQNGTLLISRGTGGALVGFCAFDVNRGGLLGPVAVRVDRIGEGLGTPLLVDALHHMRDAGATAIDVSWVGPIRPYAAVGGRISRTFFVYRKDLSP
ncbi:MAG: GNAT family N-acetyltransferase [Actinobacteria bacterium]|nr:GNAT family N-acetyltransferase [Actinomycetota bacterium]